MRPGATEFGMETCAWESSVFVGGQLSVGLFCSSSRRVVLATRTKREF